LIVTSAFVFMAVRLSSWTLNFAPSPYDEFALVMYTVTSALNIAHTLVKSKLCCTKICVKICPLTDRINSELDPRLKHSGMT
jgi:TctA family transporter